MIEDKKNRILQDVLHLRNTPTISSAVEISCLSSSSLVLGSDIKLQQSEASQKSPEKTGPEAPGTDHVTETAAGLMGGTPFPEPVKYPTQEGDFGFRFDFNAGIRVAVPSGEWVVHLKDISANTVIYAIKGGDCYIGSRKRHFLQARIEVERDGQIVWSHDFNAKGKKVAIIFPAGTIGDTLGWFPYAYRFAQQHQCELHVIMSKHMCEVLEPVYPDVHFYVGEEFEKEEALRKSLYATYYLGLFFHDVENVWQPSDFRLVGLHRTAGHILGVDPAEEPPKVAIAEPDIRPIEEPYVVIAVQASSACKLWNNPYGWIETVAFLKKLGYRVVCIDLNPVTGYGAVWNSLPIGVEDETGQRPLSERARWLKHADFFVGLSSGLSWLAWAVGTPVVMISGFTHPSNEFHTPYRVFSTHGCNSCWHDVRMPFQHENYLFCPRHHDTQRHFECTQIISAGYVTSVIQRLCDDYGFLPLSKRQMGKKKRKKGFSS